MLNGGTPQIVDSIRGVTKGKQITYFSGDDRLLVEGDLQKPAFSRMIKRLLSVSVWALGRWRARVLTCWFAGVCEVERD